jgi:hypothetical protein
VKHARELLALGAMTGAAIWMAASVRGQSNSGTTLVVRVGPEARVTPSQVSLNFLVTADGAGDVTSRTATVEAWIRVSPGQQIKLGARAAALSGPSGPVPSSTLAWSGSGGQATGGGRQAACTSGRFAGAASQDLAVNWLLSGTLTCQVLFSLADPRSLAPGSYTGTVELTLRGQ